MTEQRRLAAIVSADVAGYSRLMGRDEGGTLAALKALRQEVVDPTIATHGGRIVKTTGDGLLLEFPSVVNAVRCAVEVQTAMADRTSSIAEDRRITFRIGINLGDIIVEGEDIFGDGVNVAARLQEIAPLGGICMSSRVHDDVRDRLDTTFDDGGTQTLKNIARPVQVWRWQPCTAVVPKPAPPPTALPLPDKPSIAVLPFQNMRGDAEQEYFVDGLVEDIITSLSRFKSLFVIARNSSFTYKGKAVDIKQVGRELGVRYVLEGSVRKAAGKVRITTQLIDASTGAHLWADRFEGPLEDIFGLQDQVAMTVGGVVGAKVEEVEIEQARRRAADDPSAYDCSLRGLALYQSRTRSAIEEARRLFYRAIALDPHFSTPYGLVARCYVSRKVQGYVDDANSDESEVKRLASIVSDVGRDDAVALAWTAIALVFVCSDFEAGTSFAEQATTINPNLATGWQARGFVSMNFGDHALALEHYARASRLSPIGPDFHLVRGYVALCWIFTGRFDEAARASADALNHLPGWVGGSIASAVAHAFLGNLSEAAYSIHKVRSLRPDLCLSNLKASFAFRRPEDWGRLAEGLRIAGLPE